jgi:hypothetical protein
MKPRTGPPKADGWVPLVPAFQARDIRTENKTKILGNGARRRDPRQGEGDPTTSGGFVYLEEEDGT